MSGKKLNIQKSVRIVNKEAAFNFYFLEKYVAGLVLKGTEIKAIRMGKVNMQDSFCSFMGHELFVRNLHISPYELGTIFNHNPKADRKLLMKKKELKKLQNKLKDQGLTIVPVSLFINDKGWAKLEIALAKGKKLYDKREVLKEKDLKREMSGQFK